MAYSLSFKELSATTAVYANTNLLKIKITTDYRLQTTGHKPKPARYLYLSAKLAGMKQLIIVRHAKSSWAVVGQEDFERPLNDRGHRDAPMMAERLWEKDIRIDAFVSSPANRALTTAQYFAKKYGTDKTGVITYRELYHAMPGAFFDVISKLDDAFESVAVFAHNPGITAFANMLTDAAIDDMPTCAVFALKADAEQWKDCKSADKAFWFFDYPKSTGF